MVRFNPFQQAANLDAIRRDRAARALAQATRETVPILGVKPLPPQSPAPEKPDWTNEPVTCVEAERPLLPRPPRLPRVPGL